MATESVLNTRLPRFVRLLRSLLFQVLQIVAGVNEPVRLRPTAVVDGSTWLLPHALAKSRVLDSTPYSNVSPLGTAYGSTHKKGLGAVTRALSRRAVILIWTTRAPRGRGIILCRSAVPI